MKAQESMAQMSQAAFARLRGISRQAVNDLVKRGKIQLIEIAGRRVIDAEAADHALADGQERINRRDIEPPELRPGAASVSPAEPTALARAKAETERYRAALARLEYEKKLGRVLDTEEVLKSMELFAEIMVRDIDRLPLLTDDAAAAFTQGGLVGLRLFLKKTAKNLREAVAINMDLAEVNKPSREAS
jgi:hypothetical protein